MGSTRISNKNLLFLVFVFLIASERRASAYLDPGTGSYVFQIMIAGLVGGLFAIKMYWKKLVSLVIKKESDREKSDEEG